MPTLRVRQIAEGEHRYHALVDFEGASERRTAESRFEFQLTAQDQEDMRWYLEDYLQYPLDPAPAIAARIEARMVSIGVELFGKVLEKAPFWAEVRDRLSDTRIEIATTVAEATSIPWELLRDPQPDVPLAVRARAFVRASHDGVQRPAVAQASGGAIRILLAICRPGGGDDVPFRSVAKRLVEGLRDSDAVRLTVLRPPTFERMAEVLRDAKARGEPYHMVHFDGHGVWRVRGPRAGGHGYVLFENAALDGNRQIVGGPALGNLLAETGVLALVLNACQSAYADPPAQPLAVAPDNLHEETRALGSLAQEIMDAGAAGVVAMRYSVFVETAAHFMADLYGRLTQGDTLGEAVTFGRKQLRDQPLRGIGFDPLPLQDWVVPVVFESGPVELFPRHAAAAKLTLKLGERASGDMQGLPKRPDAGFFGRDETLLALDRSFDKQPVVLLHAYAGSGKTATAAEFARWYRETGGIAGPVLFTTFEQHRPLARVLDQFGKVFERQLEAAGKNWLALNEAERREMALQVLKQIPVLWIWDNVEPVAGFPKGTESMWSAAEQQELADFLRDARESRAKFLLTSRREERDWLRDLPARIAVPPMPFQERMELARALAEKHGRRLTDADEWRPLLDFTQGNPLTITVLVGQALRDGLQTREQIAAFVVRLRAGEAAFTDEAEEGRTRSLAASLNYGFEHAFSEAERKQLALLHLFQGFVNVEVLRRIGLPEFRGLTRGVGMRLLDRAGDVGTLTTLGGGYYSIHPAVPWFFRRLFEERYADGRELAVRAYVESVGLFGNWYHNQYVDGNREVIGVLKAEEPNLLHARTLARRHGWWPDVINTMQGLNQLYDHKGRSAEWARLVEEIVPDFVEPSTEGPLRDREREWGFTNGYRVRLALTARQWPKAERLQATRVEWERKRAGDVSVNGVRNLATTLQILGDIQRQTGRRVCVEAFQESFDLFRRIGDNNGAALSLFNLGQAHLGLGDLDEAERCYRNSLELVADGDRLGRARCISEIGQVALARFNKAKQENKPKTDLLQYLNGALRFYQQALDMMPSDAVVQLAVLHNQLGGISSHAGDFDRALRHYYESIRYKELSDDVYGAGITRHNVASTLACAGRFADAREYALAALRNFQNYGLGAQQDIQDTLDLIAAIDKAVGAT